MIRSIGLSGVSNFNDVEKVWKVFKSHFLFAVDSIAPFKTIRIKQRTEPRMSEDILKVIRLRNAAFKDYRKNGNDASFAQYKSLHNEVQGLIKNAKKIHFYR